MKRRIRSNRSIAGFTLIEVLVVIIIIGILFAIAAPGWNAFLGRQRVNTAVEQVLQTIRQTQSNARSSRTPRLIVVDPNSSGVPRIASVPFPTGSTLPVALNTISNWKTLGDSGTQPGMLRLNASTGNPLMALNGTASGFQLVFDSNGAIAQPPVVAAAQNLPFVVTVGQGSGGTSTNRCVSIDTILGATHQDAGALNGSKGCP